MIIIILAIALMLAALFYAEYRDQQRRWRPTRPAHRQPEVVDLTDPPGPMFPSKENPMDAAHEQYKLIEATGRLLLAGAELIELPDGREAIVLPADVAAAVLSHVGAPSALEREVMTRMSEAAHA